SCSALATVCSRPTLPAQTVSPTTSWPGSLNAISRARASSTPGSVSIRRGIFGMRRLYGSGRRVAGGAADPARDQEVGGVRRLGQQAVAEQMHLRQHPGVARQVGDAETGQAGLAGAQQFARTAQRQVLFGDLEAVAGRAHGFQALPG